MLFQFRNDGAGRNKRQWRTGCGFAHCALTGLSEVSHYCNLYGMLETRS
jgi:hypothetical protein